MIVIALFELQNLSINIQFEHSLAMKKIILLIITLFWFSFVINSSKAFSEEVPNDIYEPPGTYDSSPPFLLNVFVKTIISAGSCDKDNYSGCTLNDVLNDINRLDDFKPEVKIDLNTDDYINTTLNSNATLRQRGGLTSRLAPLKSFRIKLDKKSPEWHEQRRIQLIKDFDDLSRIRNKLSFDFFIEIPHLPSLHTQFVNLTIEDNNLKHKLGLYTHVEHVGKEYLKRRGWDKKSLLYKAEYFFFSNSSDLSVDQDGKPLNKRDFEKRLEIKNGKNHKPLIEMLEALDDESLDFQSEVLDIYFNRENLLTWLAVNILINNIDTKTHNYYLYKPTESKKFYIIPWDYDRAWGLAQEQDEKVVNQLPNWWFSHANWWENKLIKRFLSTPNNLELLQKTVREIKNKYLTPEKIQIKIDSYRDIVFPIIREKTDWDTIELKGETDPERVAEYNRILQLFSRNVEFNYNKFLEHLKDPMPFRINNPTIDLYNHEVTFTWDKSTSLFKQQITYDLEISSNPEFKNESIIERIENISNTTYSLYWKHPRGTYYYRIISKDTNAPSKYWQIAWNRAIKLNSGLQAYGVKSFMVAMDEEQTISKGGSISWSLLFFLLLLTMINTKKHTSSIQHAKIL